MLRLGGQAGNLHCEWRNYVVFRASLFVISTYVFGQILVF